MRSKRPVMYALTGVAVLATTGLLAGPALAQQYPNNTQSFTLSNHYGGANVTVTASWDGYGQYGQNGQYGKPTVTVSGSVWADRGFSYAYGDRRGRVSEEVYLNGSSRWGSGTQVGSSTTGTISGSLPSGVTSGTMTLCAVERGKTMDCTSRSFTVPLQPSNHHPNPGGPGQH
jgi:hypothetical protein